MLTYNAANNILKALLGETSSITLASRCYVGLSHTDPGRDGTGLSEPETIHEGNPTGYKRQLIGDSSYASSPLRKMYMLGQTEEGIKWDGKTENRDIIYFPEVLNTGEEHPWGTVKYFCIFSSETGGRENLLAYSKIVDDEGEPQDLTPEVGQLPIIRKHQLKIELE